MEKVKLSELARKMVSIEYPGGIYAGKIHKEKIWESSDYALYHLVFKSFCEREGKSKDCITTIFLREENLRYLGNDKNKLFSKKDFRPDWNHLKDDKEYAKLENFLNN